MKSVHPQLLAVVALWVTACGMTTVPATSPGRIGVEGGAAVPTLSDMKKILPATLTPSQADRELLKVPVDHVLIASADGGLESVKTLHPSWFRPFGPFGPLGSFGPYGLSRFLPFSFGGMPYFAPYLFNPMAGFWSPFAFSPSIGPYAFLASPWLSGCGVDLPFDANFAPASVGAAIGTFGCGGGIPVPPLFW